MYVVAASQQQQAISSQNIGCENVKIKKNANFRIFHRVHFHQMRFSHFFSFNFKKD